MNPIERRVYRYVPSLKTLTLVILLFGAGGVLLAVTAAGNTRSVRLLRLIDLSPQAWTRFLCVCSVLCGLFVLVAIFGFWRRAARPQEIALDEQGLVVPKSFLSREGMPIPFACIAEISITEVTGDRFLKIRLQDGTRRSITESLLPSKAAFDEIVAALRERAVLVPPSEGP